MLIFDKSVCGRRAVTLPALDVPEYNLDENFLRNAELNLPEVAEIDLVRHYIGLSLKAKGVDNVFYPLGSCTMKYNPKLNEALARNPAFTSVHPLQPASTVQARSQSCTTPRNLLPKSRVWTKYPLNPRQARTANIRVCR